MIAPEFLEAFAAQISVRAPTARQFATLLDLATVAPDPEAG